MMQISHAATAAVAGSYTENPIIAFTAGVIIHFLIDKIPHFWPETKKGKLILCTIDHGFTYITVILLAYFGKLSTGVLWAILGALTVDVVIVGIPAVYKTKLGQWHTNRQPHKTELSFLFYELIFASLFVALAVYLNR